MITFKVTSQEYSVSYKDEKEVGEKEVFFETYESMRDMAVCHLTGYSTEKEAREFYADEELEGIEEGIESVLEALKSENGIWWDENGGDDMYYGGRPEPHDGYNASGTFCIYEEVDSKDVLKEKIKNLENKKKKKLNKISKLTSEVKDIETELSKLV